jgi:hypothetical protein
MNLITPHPIPDQHRLAKATDATINRVIQLIRDDLAPPSRLKLAGVPPLSQLEAERRRRVRLREAGAS